MRRTFAILAVAAFALGASAAHAQTNWTGIYLGPEAGGASARLKASGTDSIFQLSNEHPAPPGSPNNPLIVVPGTTRDFAGSNTGTSLLYGGFIGGQIQTGSLVLGVEADAHGSRDSGRISVATILPPTLLAPSSNLNQMRDVRSRYDWSARARVGVAMGNSLLYATGGIAQTQIRLTGSDSFLTPAGAAAPEIPPVMTFQSPTIGPVVTTFTRSARLTGWTVGIGGEQRIASHLSIGLDARYLDFGSHRITFNCSFESARAGTCGSYNTPPIVIYGRTHDTTDTTPGAEPGPTRVNLTEWRLALRLVWRF
ncbi:MAG TPA: outer membrane beta-barrel protein [Allosphingosinicella sp.]|jgi:outer membrane immunogenic protein